MDYLNHSPNILHNYPVSFCMGHIFLTKLHPGHTNHPVSPFLPHYICREKTTQPGRLVNLHIFYFPSRLSSQFYLTILHPKSVAFPILLYSDSKPQPLSPNSLSYPFFSGNDFVSHFIEETEAIRQPLS